LPFPSDVLLEGQKVRIRWNDGHESVFANKRLREECPCAVCKGERGLLGKMYIVPVASSVPEAIRATAFSMVGRYAISFVWSDGHKTGIYPYDYLLELCECARCTAMKSA
jgi:DUF971 family protein